jgi:hypothetical protein
MTDRLKIQAAEAVYPLLSIFHEVNGLPLRSVRQNYFEGSRVSIVLECGSRTLTLRADENDDTVNIFLDGIADFTVDQVEIVDEQEPWKEFIGQEFGWGWIMVNQQGYLDGVVLSFGGIVPQLMITVMASSLKVRKIH